MFTGIVEEVGRIASVEELGGGRAFRIEAVTVLQGLRLGDSVAIDGACHTTTAILEDGFAVQSVATTLGRTTLGDFQAGRPVNLERALAVGDRLGGHMVQGHVDAVGEVLRVEPRDELVLIDVAIPAEIAAVTVLHGSITVDGISLTVNDLPEPGVCQVSIIPYTRDHTTIGRLQRGSRVNLEGDTIGKYVRHMLGAPGDGQTAGADLRRRWGYQS
jgi:riboflavin synthase